MVGEVEKAEEAEMVAAASAVTLEVAEGLMEVEGKFVGLELESVEETALAQAFPPQE